MKKNPILFLLLLACVPFGLFLFFFLAFGFTPKDGDELQTTLEGVVAEVSDNSILLLEGITVKDALELKKEDLLDQSSNAHSVKIEEDIDELEVGMKVIVWVTTIAESYPTQSTADDFEIKKD